MKKVYTYILLILSVITSIPVFAQDNDKILNRPYADLKRFHYGFSVGFFNQSLWMTHNGMITDNGEQWFADQSGLAPGFCVNILGDLRLAEHFNLRLTPGMYFGNRTLTFRNAKSGNVEKQDLKNASIVLPLDVKMSAKRWRNLRPYVTTGVLAAFDLTKEKDDELLWMKGTDMFLTIGFGLDVYVPYFKFIPEVKFCFGLKNMIEKNRPDLADDPNKLKFTQSLDKAISNMVVFTFYFE